MKTNLFAAIFILLLAPATYAQFFGGGFDNGFTPGGFDNGFASGGFDNGFTSGGFETFGFDTGGSFDTGIGSFDAFPPNSFTSGSNPLPFIPTPLPPPQPQPPRNTPPLITSTPPITATVGVQYSYHVSLSDPDGPFPLILTLTGPTGMTIDSNQLITWTPTTSQLGSQSVRLSVSDSLSTTEQNYVITVSSTPIPPPPPPQPNQPAVWNTLQNKALSQASSDGTVIYPQITSECHDADDQFLQFSIASTSTHFTLFFLNGDLIIDGLDPSFTGTETITLTCNGVPASFTLTIQAGQPAETEEKDTSPRIQIHSIRSPDAISAGDSIPITVSLENTGHKKLEDITVDVSIPELGLRAPHAGPFDLHASTRDSVNFYLELPLDVTPGTYELRITINTNGLHRIVHRDIEIE